MIMGMRSADPDPGIVLSLMREGRLSATAIESLLSRESGLAGISGGESDMRRFEPLALRDRRAQLAIDMFGYSAHKHIAAMVSVLGGLDLLLFTGGIGRHDKVIGGRICDGLRWLVSFETHIMPAQEDEHMAMVAAVMLQNCPA